jgi:nucleotide-binding universal stress UspA family protein
MNARKTILVPVDFSPQSKAALEYAAAFAKDSGAELLIVHAMDLSIRRIEGLEPVDALGGLDAALHDVKPTDESIPCAYRMLDGPPAQAILKIADEENVEMIVMGTHGRSGVPRLLMGSVAEAVVQKAKCPVLTLRQPTEKATAGK